LRCISYFGSAAVTYAIDGRNHRIAKVWNSSVQQEILYHKNGFPVAELSATGGVVSVFAFGLSQNVPDLMVRAGNMYRFVKDELGSVRLIVNVATGEVAQQIDYDELGNSTIVMDTLSGSGTASYVLFQPFGFAGGLYDADTGLVRFGRRDYDPSVGRWTSKDPIRFGGGGTNLYSYAFSDPINLIDVTGKQGTAAPIDVCLMGVGMATTLSDNDTADLINVISGCLPTGKNVPIIGCLIALIQAEHFPPDPPPDPGPGCEEALTPTHGPDCPSAYVHPPKPPNACFEPDPSCM
jgi:RHS repeat-associated protein